MNTETRPILTDDELIMLASDFKSSSMQCGVLVDDFDAIGFARAALEAAPASSAMAQDAARYRFLSGKDGNVHEPIDNAMLFVAFDANDTYELDAAIDAALQSQPSPVQPTPDSAISPAVQDTHLAIGGQS